MEKEVFNDLICPTCGHSLIMQDSNSIKCLSCEREFRFWKDTLMLSTDHDFYYGELSKDKMNRFIELIENKGIKKAVAMAKEEKIITDDYYHMKYAFSNNRAAFKLLLEPSKDKIALDLGCGLGIVSLNLATCFYKVYAVDATKERVQFVYLRGKQNGFENIIPLCAGDDERLPFKDQFFDCVVLNGVLEWVAESRNGSVYDIQKNFLIEINRILKNRGVLYIGIENRYGYNYFKGIPEDHTGLRFGSLLPRYLSNIYSLLIRKKPYRTYTHSWAGYRRLLKKAGFFESKMYLPGNDYRFIDGFIDPENPDWMSNYFKMKNGNYLKAILKQQISKKMYPTFSILAKKKGKLMPWITECCSIICNEYYNRGTYDIKNMFITETETCIIEMDVKGRITKELIVKVPLNNISDKKCNSESYILNKIYNDARIDYAKHYIPQFVAKGELNGIRYYIQEKISGRVLSNDLYNLQCKQNVFRYILRIHKETSCTHGSELFAFAEGELNDILGLIDTDKRKDIHELIKIGKRFDNDFNNIRVFSHGDFWEGNILWDKKGTLKGIIDWVDAQEFGLPMIDIIHMLYYSKMLNMNSDYGEFCVKYINDVAHIIEPERSFLKSYCGEIYGDYSDPIIKRGFFLYCLYQLLKRVPQMMEVRFDEKWIDKNISYLKEAVTDIPY